MADHLNYTDRATLLAYRKDGVLPDERRTTTLEDAVRTVIETWTGQQLVDVFIATPSGPIEGLEAVRAIYDRADFPRPV